MPALSYNRYLPYFNERYFFEQCSASRKEQLLEFIDLHWKKNHAFVACPKLLDWQHYDAANNHYNFSVAIHRETDEIHALMGFIPSAQFGGATRQPIRWGALWKNCNDDEPGLGLMVEAHMVHFSPAYFACGVGLSQTCATLGKKQHNDVGIVERYYILNPNVSSFQLVQNQNAENFCSPFQKQGENASFISLSAAAYHDIPTEFFSLIPAFKSKQYYINRYFLHPIYQYQATALVRQGKITAVFFWRLNTYCDARCIRIVDFIGDSTAISGCKSLFLQLLQEQLAEFVDFMNVGIPKQHFLDAGFLDRRDSEIVLAHYFEPFLLKNDDVDYKWQCEKDVALAPLIFKGDSDLDRPNVITG